MGLRPAHRRLRPSASCSSASAPRASAGSRDIFNGIRGGGGTPSVDKPLKRDAEEPEERGGLEGSGDRVRGEAGLPARDPRLAAVHDAAPEGRRPGSTRSPATYSSSSTRRRTDAAARADRARRTAQATSFGAAVHLSARPRPRRASPDPIGSAISQAANENASTTALSARQSTATELVDVYQKLAKLDPAEPSVQLQLGQQAAKDAGDTATSRSPPTRSSSSSRRTTPSVPQVKAQLKQLKAQSPARLRRARAVRLPRGRRRHDPSASSGG